MQEWYIRQNGKSVGPIAAVRLKEFARSGKIIPSSSVRLGSTGKWVLASSVKGLFSTDTAKAKVAASSTPDPVEPISKSTASPARGNPAGSDSKSVGRFRETGNPYAAPRDSLANDVTPRTHTGGKHPLSEAFLTIWFQPRKTIRWLIDERNPREAILLISIVFGMKYLDNVLSSEDGSIAFGLLAAPIAIPISAIIGIVVLYFFGLLNRVVGRSLGGTGDGPAVRMAFAWSFIPTFAAIPITILFLAVDAFMPPTLFVPLWVFNGPILLLSIWGIVIQIAGLSEAHQFSIFRAIGTFLLVILILLALAMSFAAAFVMIAMH